MAQSWFYLHEGQTHGPVSTEQLKELASLGKVGPFDLIWPEGSGAAEAVSAEGALDFSNIPAPPAPHPAAPPPGAPPGPLPDWLGDVARVQHTGPASAAPASVPEWIEDLRLWAAQDASGAGFRDSGFDPQAGAILDPQKFQKWQKRKTRFGTTRQPGVSNASFMEVFRKARLEVEEWMNDGKNRLRLLHADPDEIKKNPQIRAILEKYSAYGKEMRDRLRCHLKDTILKRKEQYRTGK